MCFRSRPGDARVAQHRPLFSDKGEGPSHSCVTCFMPLLYVLVFLRPLAKPTDTACQRYMDQTVRPQRLLFTIVRRGLVE